MGVAGSILCIIPIVVVVYRQGREQEKKEEELNKLKLKYLSDLQDANNLDINFPTDFPLRLKLQPKDEVRRRHVTELMFEVPRVIKCRNKADEQIEIHSMETTIREFLPGETFAHDVTKYCWTPGDELAFYFRCHREVDGKLLWDEMGQSTREIYPASTAMNVVTVSLLEQISLPIAFCGLCVFFIDMIISRIATS